MHLIIHIIVFLKYFMRLSFLWLTLLFWLYPSNCKTVVLAFVYFDQVLCCLHFTYCIFKYQNRDYYNETIFRSRLRDAHYVTISSHYHLSISQHCLSLESMSILKAKPFSFIFNFQLLFVFFTFILIVIGYWWF